VSTENDDKRVVIRRRIAATREELFDAWIDPEGMKEWMCPGDIVSAEVQLDARVGGSLLIVMRGPTESHEHRGEFKVVERPSKLVFSWTGKTTAWLITRVTVEFFQVSENESELVLTHENFPSKEVRDRHLGGWSRIVTLLEQYIRTRAS
jgi:uncharacterized protein YndB with AHSA1/START domain